MNEQETPLSTGVDVFRSACATPACDAEVAAEYLEYACRGDRVPASLWRPGGRGAGAAGRLHVVLCSEPDAGVAQASAWARQGDFVFAPDLPLSGRRASPKLSDQLRPEPPGDLAPPERERLVEAAREQAVADVRRGLAVLRELYPDALADAAVEIHPRGAFAHSVARRLAAEDPSLAIHDAS